MLMIVGSYGDGLRMYAFDPENVTFRLLDSLDLPSPSYLTIDATTRTIFAVNELKDETAALVAVRIDSDWHTLRLLNAVRTGGASPCHVDKHGDLVATANYRGGSLSLFRVGPTGEILSLLSVVKGSTGGPDLSRQQVPHVHCALFSPDGNYLFATDFSADRIIRLETDRGGAGGT